MKLEQSFMDFMLHHQQRHNRSYKFLVLMEALQAAAKYIQYYYQTGSLKNLMGEAGFTNVQGENVLKMDDIADSIVLHYLQRSEQVIRAVTEEEAEPVVMNEETGRYFVYYDPLDGSSNVKHNLPVGFMFAIGKRNLEGPEDNHLRKGSELRAAGIYLIPNGVFTLALADTGVFRFHMDETMTYVIPENAERLVMPENQKSWELSFNSANRGTFAPRVREWIEENESDVVTVDDLVYSKVSQKPARWVLAVPAGSKIERLEDLLGRLPHVGVVIDYENARHVTVSPVLRSALCGRRPRTHGSQSACRQSPGRRFHGPPPRRIRIAG